MAVEILRALVAQFALSADGVLGHTEVITVGVDDFRLAVTVGIS